MTARRRAVLGSLLSAIPRLLAMAIAAGSLVLAVLIVRRTEALFHQTPPELSDLGSYYGGTVAPLLSLAVFAMLLLAFLEQRRQVDLQERELGESRRRTERQAFESTFYQVLEILRRVAESIEIHPRGTQEVSARGAAAFRDAADQVTARFLASREAGHLDLDLAIDRAVLESCFTEDSDFGHYFRTLVYLFRHLDGASERDATSYALLIAAQMGRYEAELVFAVGSTSRGQELRPYLERFQMFDDAHIRRELLVLRHFYAAQAFTI